MPFGNRPASIRENLFGGQGAVAVFDLLAGAPAPPFAAVLGCRLEPGGRVGRHRQDQFPEVVIGLAGQGEASVNGTAHPLGPGDVVHLPLGSILALRNLSAEAPLDYLIIKAAKAG